MNKQIVIYKENSEGKIAKFVDGVECVDGVVVDEGRESEGDSGNAFFNFFASFFRSSHKPYNDNGREYNPASGNWEYTAEANGNAEAPQDYQGSVLSWDGYNGE